MSEQGSYPGAEEETNAAERDEEADQDESLIHLLGEPETEDAQSETAYAPEEPPSFLDVCLYLADHMQVIVSARRSDGDDNEPSTYAYAPTDRIAAAQVWLNCAGALHNAQAQERQAIEMMRQRELIERAQGGQGLFVPVGISPQGGKH